MGESAVCFDPVEEIQRAFPVVGVGSEGIADGLVVDGGLVLDGIWGLRVEIKSGVWEKRGRKEKMNR